MEPVKDYEKHLRVIRLKILGQLEELGIAGQTPSLGVLRIVNDVIMNHWGEVFARENPSMMEDAVDVSEFKMTVDRSADGEGLMIGAVDDEGGRLNIAFVHLREKAMYCNGHRLTFEEDGSIISKHEDGSTCDVGCRGCDDPDVHVSEEGDLAYAWCRNCGTITETYGTKYVAVAAWLIGKVGEDVGEE